MSAAQWRKAMNAGAGRTAWPRPRGRRPPARPHGRRACGAAAARIRARAGCAGSARGCGARHVLVLLAVLAYPLLAPPFFTFQIGAQALALGLIALSLTFLAGYGGMVSLAQMTVAGIAGYMYAIFATSGTDISLGWPWWLAVVLALAIATVCGTLIGWFSVRTEGIYTIMITLAIGVAFYYLVQQNYSVFNGFQGFQSVKSPRVLGRGAARSGAVLLSRAVLGARRLFRRQVPRCARRSGWPCRASATTHGAWPRWASTSPPTASPPMRWPASSPRSAGS